MTFRERRPEILSESRMRSRMSGSMSGDWRRIHGTSIATPPDERGGQQLRGTYQHRASRRLHQEIFSPIRDLGVNRLGSVSMARTLCACQGGFQVAVKALGLERRQNLITERGKTLQPEIDSLTRDRAIEDRADGGFIPRNSPITPSKTLRNAGNGIQAALRAALSLAGLKASVSRGEI
jgi:hypothetical protein